MNKELASILKSKISDLPFIDVLAGLAQTVVQDDPIHEDSAAMLVRRFPVSYDTNQPNDCMGGPERSLIPDSSKKSIIYFEDFGSQSTGRLHNLPTFTSNLRLICWMNRAKITGNIYSEISGRCMSLIIDRLVGKNPINQGMFTRLIINVARIPPQEVALFGRYTYEERDRQYLRPPFEFFGIDFSCNYAINTKCLDQTQWNNETCF